MHVQTPIAAAFLAITLAGADVAQAEERIICRADIIAASLHDHETRRVLVVAHRGAHLRAPENSLRSIQHAVEIGADVVELDVRLTSDGVPVLMHDPKLDRTTRGQGPVSEMTADQITRLHLLEADGTRSDQTVPTLREALTLSADRIVVDIDLKIDELEPVLAVVGETIAMHQVVFYHYDLETLSRLRALAPDAQIMPLARTAQDARYLGANQDIEIVHLRAIYANAGLVDYLDQQGSSTWLNALGRVDGWLAEGSLTAADQLIETEVDLIQTDQPERLLAILDARGLRPHDPGLSFEAPCLVVQPSY